MGSQGIAVMNNEFNSSNIIYYTSQAMPIFPDPPANRYGLILNNTGQVIAVHDEDNAEVVGNIFNGVFKNATRFEGKNYDLRINCNSYTSPFINYDWYIKSGAIVSGINDGFNVATSGLFLLGNCENLQFTGNPPIRHTWHSTFPASTSSRNIFVPVLVI